MTISVTKIRRNIFQFSLYF